VRARARSVGILEVSVVGMADSQSGETPVVFVVKKDPTLTEEDVVGFARCSLASYTLASLACSPLTTHMPLPSRHSHQDRPAALAMATAPSPVRRYLM
jgi:acyl-CoA synthetase (AMP-forming)/AMP-acid ligase II